MRTVRDNYYIITGHTYEEYCKKYHRGIGKGKLLSFTEDEVKYLKKNKHYWEVIGPDGKTLYCQINRFKPKYVIIPSVIAALAGGGVAAFLLTRFTGKVTEDQWKNAIENIINVKEYRELHYVANGSMQVTENDSNVTFEIKNLTVDGDYEEATQVKDGEETQLKIYRYKHLPLRWDETNNRVTTHESLLRDYIAYGFGDFYSTMKDFTYESNAKAYTYSENQLEGSYFDYMKCSISFASKDKVKNITCEYKLKESKNTFVGYFDYEFTNKTLDHWANDTASQEELNKKTFALGNKLEVDNNKVVSSPGKLKELGKNKAFIITLDSSNPYLPKNLTHFRIWHTTSEAPTAPAQDFFWPSGVRMFKNDVELEKGSDADFQWIYNPTNKWVEGFRLIKPLGENEVLTIKLSLSIMKIDSYENCWLEITNG